MVPGFGEQIGNEKIALIPESTKAGEIIIAVNEDSEEKGKEETDEGAGFFKMTMGKKEKEGEEEDGLEAGEVGGGKAEAGGKGTPGCERKEKGGGEKKAG